MRKIKVKQRKMREKNKRIFKMFMSLLLVIGICFNTVSVNADQASSDFNVTILPGETSPDKEIPPVAKPGSNEQKEKSPDKKDRGDLEGRLPKTGMPADNLSVNAGLTLLLIGILLLIASQERDEEYEVL